MHLPRHDFDSPAEDVARSLMTAGCAIVDAAGMAPNFRELTHSLKAQLRDTPFGTGVFVGHKTKRLGAMIRRFKATHDLATNPMVLACMDAALLENCSRYQLHITQAIQVHPGETAQVIHRDSAMYSHVPIKGELMVNAMWAASEFSDANGATRVVPGSHRWPPDRQPADDEVAVAEMLPGSVLLYLGSTLHGAGANRTSSPRTGIVMGYCLGWLRQYENQYLAVPPEHASKLSDELAALIGYAAHRPNLGLYECRDPMDFLKTELPGHAAADDVLDAETKRILDGLVSAD